jgi:hypothetical protein
MPLVRHLDFKNEKDVERGVIKFLCAAGSACLIDT